MSNTSLELLNAHACFGGAQRVYQHASREIGLPMKFSVYLPPQALQGTQSTSNAKVPALVYLARPVTGPRREIALLTFIIGAGIAPQLFREGLLNQQAWGWAVVSGLMVVALWRCLRVRRA